MSAQGTTTLDFGSKATDTSVFVSAPAITGSQLVEAWIFPAATTNNTADNHWVDTIKVIAGNVVAGSGFTIYGRCDVGFAHGKFNVGYVYN